MTGMFGPLGTAIMIPLTVAALVTAHADAGKPRARPAVVKIEIAKVRAHKPYEDRMPQGLPQVRIGSAK
jgi:hypothetical protein